MRRVLIKMIHGLGDTVQFTSVLRHIREQRTDWVVDMRSKVGKHSCFHGLCRKSFHEDEPIDYSVYDEIIDVGWYENYNRYTDRPNTKVTNSLAEEFDLRYNPELAAYQIRATAEDAARADAFLESLGAPQVERNGRLKRKALICHYEGNTSPEKKNLHPSHIKAAIHTLLPHGYKAVILDWDKRSGLHDPDAGIHIPGADHQYWTGTGTGDAARIKALADAADLFVGIDSGPGHVAGASNTPAIIVWRGHHPFQFYDPCPNVEHLVPDHECHFFQSDTAREYYLKHYRQRFYPTKTRDNIATVLRAMVLEKTGIPDVAENGLIQYRGMWLRRDMFAQDQEIVEDVIHDDSYQTRHYDMSKWKLVIDVGAQIGSFACKVHAANPDCKIVCVEPSPDNLRVLRKNVGHFAEIVPKAMVSRALAGKPVRFGEPSGVDRPSTGGGSVVGSHYAGKEAEQHEFYDVDTCCLRDVLNGRKADCLKLDCEGGEYQIIESGEVGPSQVGIIFGEWHGSFNKFNEFRQRTVPNFDFGDMSRHDDHTTNGVFHLAPR